MRDPSWMELSAQYRKPPQETPRTEPAAAPADEYPYLDAWIAYRQIWRRFWTFAPLTVGVILLLVFGLPQIGLENVSAVLFPLAALAMFGFGAVTMIQVVSFACPRCGRPYHNPLMSPMMQWKCRHCGLPKLAVNDAGKRLGGVKVPKR